MLTEKSEQAALAALDFEKEQREIAGYWRRRLDESARLITPEPMLNEFYRAHAGHLLINCEGDPDSAGRRFARVGSFAYGAYGNESCMMVVDLDRRGYHKEAQECLDAWLHYQGTVALPGDFSTKKGVLYGAGGLEAGGYNQHHGWILWMLGEHYRFTRDEAWLRGAAPGILAGADWIINETKRTANRHELERGLLPPGQPGGHRRLVDVAFDQLLHVARAGLRRLGVGTDQASGSPARAEGGRCLSRESAGELPQGRRPVAGGAFARRHRGAAHPVHGAPAGTLLRLDLRDARRLAAPAHHRRARLALAARPTGF